VPVRVSGKRAEHLVAYVRQHEGKRVLVVVPRFFVGLLDKGRWGNANWGDTMVEVGTGVGTARDVITGVEVKPRGELLAISELLEVFPGGLFELK
jgi:(1->4)-alpha-D-glucan 1-alpha-D-glucosylmutase